MPERILKSWPTTTLVGAIIAILLSITGWALGQLSTDRTEAIKQNQAAIASLKQDMSQMRLDWLDESRKNADRLARIETKLDNLIDSQ